MPTNTRSSNKKISTIILTHNTTDPNMALDQSAQSSQTGNTSGNTSHLSLPSHFADKLILYVIVLNTTQIDYIKLTLQKRFKLEVL